MLALKYHARQSSRTLSASVRHHESGNVLRMSPWRARNGPRTAASADWRHARRGAAGSPRASLLTPAERAQQTARRKEIYEALHPETKNGAVGNGREKVRQNGEATLPDRFTRATAIATGQGERTRRGFDFALIIFFRSCRRWRKSAASQPFVTVSTTACRSAVRVGSSFAASLVSRVRRTTPGSATSASRIWRASWMSLRVRPRSAAVGALFSAETMLTLSPPGF